LAIASAQKQAFQQLKKLLQEGPVLILPDPERAFRLVVNTGASGYAVGAVLQQDQGQGLQPIAYLSKKTLPAETHYPVHEQELLAVVHALRAWRHYLHGSEFTVRTDHKSLEYLRTQPQLSSRQSRWKDVIDSFDFTIEYVDGKQNSVADALSRRSDHRPAEKIAVERPAPDSESGETPQHQIGTVSSFLADIWDAYPRDPAYVAEQRKRHREPSHPLQLKGGFLYHGERLYIPNDQELKARILHECHDAPWSGHLGTEKTLEQAKRRFYWPGMDQEIRRYVSSCDACQRNKPSQQAPMGLLQPLPIPKYPWQQVSMDLITQLPRTRSGHDAIVVFVDKLTKMVHYAATTTNVTAPQLAHIFLEQVVRHHGLPSSILSDRDPRFTGNFWRTLWKCLGTQLTMSTAFHPQTDGQTERANRTLEEMLRAYVNFRQDDWDKHLVAAEIAFNSSKHASTGFTPYYLNYGRDVMTPLDLAIEAARTSSNPEAAERIRALHEDLERARQSLQRAQQRQARHVDGHRRHVEFKVGDQVLLSTQHLKLEGADSRTTKFAYKYIGPFKIKRVVNSNAYELELPAGMQIHPVINISRLKKYQDGREQFPLRQVDERPGPAAVTAEGEEVYEVESILAKRGRGARVEYLVKWRGWPVWESTWHRRADVLPGAEETVERFEATVAARA
jgi:hypothetical protein